MFKKIIPPIVLLSFLLFNYNYNNEAIYRVSFQTAVLFCLILILVAPFPDKILISRPAIIITFSLLSAAILGIIAFDETIFVACSITFSLLLLFILIKKYNKHNLNYFFRQLLSGLRKVKK